MRHSTLTYTYISLEEQDLLIDWLISQAKKGTIRQTTDVVDFTTIEATSTTLMTNMSTSLIQIINWDNWGSIKHFVKHLTRPTSLITSIYKQGTVGHMSCYMSC